ncbi:lanosterol 14-alpha demethylase erg11 [Paraphysoderma sedebokerense]|nr:lanosterol 14-alpha demethylase erg11 [Paraphysoderma sedebokerense]
MSSQLSILLATYLPQPVISLSTSLGVSPLLLSSALLLIPLFIYQYISSSAQKSHALPPHIPHLVPFIGSMVTMGMEPIKFLQNAKEKYGPIFTFTMFGREMTYVLGPDGNNFLFNAKLANVSAEEAYRTLTKPVFGEDVVYDVNNAVLMEQKRFIKGALSIDNLRSYVSYIEEETVHYLSRWKGVTGTAELAKAMAELTIMTASRCLMGKEVRSKLDETVAQLYLDLDGGFQPINLLFEWLPLASYKKRDIAHKKMHDLFRSIIEERRKSGNMDNNDVLQHLMSSAEYKNGRACSDKEAANLMIALLMAGQHTSSTTSTWALSFLAENPNVVQDLIKEQKEVLGENRDGITFDKLKQMVLLDSVIRETLRLRPPIIMIIRKVMEDIHYQGYVIPKGHYLGASPAVSQLDESVYTNATKFDPYRWIKTDEKMDDLLKKEKEQGLDYGFGIVGGSARSHYLPFGAGRHRCIGEPFAYIQLKTILATFIKEFDSFKFAAGQKFPKSDYTTLIVMPEKPVMIEYHRESRKNTDAQIVDGMDILKSGKTSEKTDLDGMSASA